MFLVFFFFSFSFFSSSYVEMSSSNYDRQCETESNSCTVTTFVAMTSAEFPALILALRWKPDVSVCVIGPILAIAKVVWSDRLFWTLFRYSLRMVEQVLSNLCCPDDVTSQQQQQQLCLMNSTAASPSSSASNVHCLSQQLTGKCYLRCVCVCVCVCDCLIQPLTCL